MREIDCYFGSKKEKNTKTITWTSDVHLQDRQLPCHVIPFGENPDTHFVQARNIDSIKDAFSLLFYDETFDLLVLQRNIYIKIKLEKLFARKEHICESPKYPYLYETSLLEMLALIDFMYVR